MTRKTIPAYLEDERRKLGDSQLRMGEEAARIQTCTMATIALRKQPRPELPSPVEAAAKAGKTAAAARKKPRAAQKTARWLDFQV
jgi:hypothetical protein